MRATGGLLLSMAAIGMAACGDDDEPAAPAAGSGGGEAAKERVKIAAELTLTGVKFGQDTKAGMEAYAKEDGAVDLETQGPPSIDPVTAQKQASDMLAKRPDGFAVSPFPPELWQRTLSTIKQRVPNSLAFNIKPAGKPEDVDAGPIKTFVGVDDTDSARVVMRKTIELAELGPETTGEVIMGQCVAGGTGVLFERIQGFKEVATELLPKAKLTVFDSKVEPQANTSAWTAQLQSSPNPVLAIGTCDQDGTSLYKIKQQKGSTFPVGAVETPPEVIRGIEDGTILASSAVNWHLEGYMAAKLLAAGARGEEVPEGFVDIGSTTITKENVAEIKERDSSLEATAAWYAPKIKAMDEDLASFVKPMQDAWK